MASKLINSSGKVTQLRAVEAGTRHGPPGDQIDVEVVVQLSTHPDRAMGFKLREDDNRYAHQAMFDLLRDAFANNFTAHLDYSIDLEAGKKNGLILRVWLTR
ncbi:hypothetical protein ACFQS1_00900 [Paractinoplanes rhizophilus]|jgi:hypothetical protein|uniref:Uncharacterized protein n=1 Tax=Paractinoplanes rhizophilus TaxID=1416877 RepID=A0ABW2HHA8_9ACTN|nr:hypothetical protein [Actinoplanes sp.]